MQGKSTQRFLVDTNLFIAAVKKWTRSTDLLVKIDNPSEDNVIKCKKFFPENAIADVVHAATCLQSGAVLITNDKHFNEIRNRKIIEVWKISEAIKRLL